jgi:hypothetical protein
MPSSDLAGTWTYRSFRNDPTPVDGDPQKALDLFSPKPNSASKSSATPHSRA